MGEEVNEVSVVDQAIGTAKGYIIRESNESMGRLLDVASGKADMSLEDAKAICQDVNLWLVFLFKRICLDGMYQVKRENGDLIVREGNGRSIR